MKEADSVGLSSSLAAKVRDGTIDINQYNSNTQELIKEYQEWYEKALDCSDAIQELHENLAELYEDNFNNIQSDFDNQLSLFEHLSSTYNNATMGLHAMNYDIYMAQAEQYAEEIQEIEKQMANDPYNTEIIERKEELLELQQDSILAAEDEKQAIVILMWLHQEIYK